MSLELGVRGVKGRGGVGERRQGVGEGEQRARRRGKGEWDEGK